MSIFNKILTAVGLSSTAAKDPTATVTEKVEIIPPANGDFIVKDSKWDILLSSVNKLMAANKTKSDYATQSNLEYAQLLEESKDMENLQKMFTMFNKQHVIETKMYLYEQEGHKLFMETLQNLMNYSKDHPEYKTCIPIEKQLRKDKIDMYLIAKPIDVTKLPASCKLKYDNVDKKFQINIVIGPNNFYLKELVTFGYKDRSDNLKNLEDAGYIITSNEATNIDELQKSGLGGTFKKV